MTSGYPPDWRPPQERPDPSEQPCKEGATIPNGPGGSVPPTSGGGGTPPSTTTPISIVLNERGAFRGNLNVSIAAASVAEAAMILCASSSFLQDYTNVDTPFWLIPPGVTITVKSMWVKLDFSPITNGIPVQLLKNGAGVGPVLSFPIGTGSPYQHTTENVSFTAGDTIFYSGGDQDFDGIPAFVVVSYTPS